MKLWGCATPCNADFVAKALGPKWSHKLFVNAELLNPDTQNSPNMQLYEAILWQYGSSVSGGVGSFSQMGFAIGRSPSMRSSRSAASTPSQASTGR